MGMSLLKFRWRSKEITVLFGPAGPVFLRFRPWVPLPEGSGKPFGLPVLAPAGEVLSLTPEKVPKERVQGEGPLDTPRSVALRPSLSGVLDSRLRRFPRRPPGFCIRMLRLSHPTGAPGWVRPSGMAHR